MMGVGKKENSKASGGIYTQMDKNIRGITLKG